jgi:hypothetical protein
MPLPHFMSAGNNRLQYTTARYVNYKIPTLLAVYYIIPVFFPRLTGSKQMSEVNVQTHAGFYNY